MQKNLTLVSIFYILILLNTKILPASSADSGSPVSPVSSDTRAVTAGSFPQPPVVRAVARACNPAADLQHQNPYNPMAASYCPRFAYSDHDLPSHDLYYAEYLAQQQRQHHFHAQHHFNPVNPQLVHAQDHRHHSHLQHHYHPGHLASLKFESAPPAQAAQAQAEGPAGVFLPAAIRSIADTVKQALKQAEEEQKKRDWQAAEKDKQAAERVRTLEEIIAAKDAEIQRLKIKIQERDETEKELILALKQAKTQNQALARATPVKDEKNDGLIAQIAQEKAENQRLTELLAQKEQELNDIEKTLQATHEQQRKESIANKAAVRKVLQESDATILRLKEALAKAARPAVQEAQTQTPELRPELAPELAIAFFAQEHLNRQKLIDSHDQERADLGRQKLTVQEDLDRQKLIESHDQEQADLGRQKLRELIAQERAGLEKLKQQKRS
jgi:hypothetical protein